MVELRELGLLSIWLCQFGKRNWICECSKNLHDSLQWAIGFEQLYYGFRSFVRGCVVFCYGKARLGGLGANTVVCGRVFLTDRLWIFFMCTFRWSVLLKTWPQVLQGWGTKRPWCWCLTWRRRVHFRLNMRAHMAHWNLGPSGVWHIV